MYKDGSIKKYLDDLAAKLPAPGGGSAAALNAAMGAGLISMVINFTLGKPRYAQYQTTLKDMLAKSENLRQEFINLVDLDVTAYQSKNIRDALNVPFMLSRLCFEAIKLCPDLIKKGNSNLISDVAVAAVFLESAFSGARYNIDINLRALDDKKLSSAIKKELDKKEERIKRMRKLVEEKVGKIIRG